MHVTMRVDLHCHSLHSDGAMSPRDLAEYLVADGVVVAALADHNTLDGLDEFRRTLARREVGCIAAVEITTQFDGREVHVLAYGIDPANPELQTVLASLRQASMLGRQSVAESLRTRGFSAPHVSGMTAPDGYLDLPEAIALVHRAGGQAFLAHPLLVESDYARLDALLARLKTFGLDGIEAIYASFTDEQRTHLCELAARHSLLVSAGTDVHERKALHDAAGIEMPLPLWKAFRDAVHDTSSPVPLPVIPPTVRQRRLVKWRALFFHFIFPTFLAIALFITAVYAIILPTFEKTLLERKREMIRELTNSAWSILAGFERDERAGRLTREDAQALAISRVESLRYGRAGKDYFWLQDMTPRILMHPYRPDLNGANMANYRDPNGDAIFVEFAQKVRRQQEGYVRYVWQWNDDPNRLVPKESYVRGFAPWGWIIGTGLYTEDVQQEIIRIERSLVQTTLVISVIVVLLLMYVLFESLRLERERAEVEESLRNSTERYRSLVEATTEGTLLVLEGRCRYANPIFLQIAGYTLAALEMLDLADIFPEIAGNDAAWEQLHRLLNGEEAIGGFDALLRRRDGVLTECIVSSSRISVAGRTGFILLIRRVVASTDEDSRAGSRSHQLFQVVEESALGIFRARLSARGTLLAYNQAAQQLLFPTALPERDQPALADCFRDAARYDDFQHTVQRQGTATVRLNLVSADNTRRTVVISARSARDEQGNARYIDGVVDDVTEHEGRDKEQAATIERLQTSLLFLHEPVSRLESHGIFCALDMPIAAVAQRMSKERADAALIQSNDGAIVGIVTDSDMRQRVIADAVPALNPVHRIMSAPIVTIPERASIYEALLLMEERHIHHLVLVDDTGHIGRVIHGRQMLQFRNYGPIVLTREVENAATPEDVAQLCRRVPEFARVLVDCGAKPHAITRMISAVCNSATQRLIALAEQELGPPPAPFVFLTLGSQGRQEMTLASDQDNAILYDASDAGVQAQAEVYFPAMGKYVCGWLDRAGYPLCRGEVMAQNPRWCQPLPVWKDYFRGWISHAEPQQLLEFTIFFDFHALYGALDIARELRRYIFEYTQQHPAFFSHFAHNSLSFRPPTRLFGRYLGSSGEQAGLLDLKEAMMPIVSFARLYALRQQVAAPHTLDRLFALQEADVLSETSRREISDAYDFLMRLRLRQQLQNFTEGQLPDNALNPRRLGQVESTLLHQSFSQIAAVQKRISYDFLGGTE